MDRTSNVFTQAFGLFKTKPKKISARTARASSARKMAAIGGRPEQRQKKGRRSSDEPTFAASDADLDLAEWVR